MPEQSALLNAVDAVVKAKDRKQRLDLTSTLLGTARQLCQAELSESIPGEVAIARLDQSWQLLDQFSTEQNQFSIRNWLSTLPGSPNAYLRMYMATTRALLECRNENIDVSRDWLTLAVGALLGKSPVPTAIKFNWEILKDSLDLNMLVPVSPTQTWSLSLVSHTIGELLNITRKPSKSWRTPLLLASGNQGFVGTIAVESFGGGSGIWYPHSSNLLLDIEDDFWNTIVNTWDFVKRHRLDRMPSDRDFSWRVLPPGGERQFRLRGTSHGVAVAAALHHAISSDPIDERTAISIALDNEDGRLLPVQRIREKVLAASKAMVERVVLHEANVPEASNVLNGIADVKIVGADEFYKVTRWQDRARREEQELRLRQQPRIVSETRVHQGDMRSFVISSSGRYLASTSNDRTIRLYNLNDQEEVWSISKSDTWWSSAIAITPDESRVVASWLDHFVYVLDLETGRELHKIDCGHVPLVSRIRNFPSVFKSNTICDIAITPNSCHAVLAGRNPNIKVLDIETGTVERELKGHSKVVVCASISADGEYVATGSKDCTIKVWELTTGNLVATLAKHTAPIACVTFTPDGEHVVSGSSDGTILIWDVWTSKSRMLGAHEGCVNSLTFTHYGDVLISSSQKDITQAWDCNTRKQLYSLGISNTRTVIASTDGSTIYADSRDNLVTMDWTSPPHIDYWTKGKDIDFRDLVPESIAYDSGGFFVDRETDLMWMIPFYGESWHDHRRTGQPISLSWLEAVQMFGRGRRINLSGQMAISPVLRGEDSGCPQVSAGAYTNYIPGNRSLSFAGYSDWRLPTIEECLSFSKEDYSYEFNRRLGGMQRWTANDSNLTFHGYNCAWITESMGNTVFGDLTINQRYPVRLVRRGRAYLSSR